MGNKESLMRQSEPRTPDSAEVPEGTGGDSERIAKLAEAAGVMDREQCCGMYDAHAVARMVESLERECAAMRDALERINQWSQAYPLKVFPEPDFKRAADVLEAAGMTLDAISASNMRHVVKGVGDIARAARPKPDDAHAAWTSAQLPTTRR
jgi:hypothetical protein